MNHKEALERYKDAREYVKDQYSRIQEDFIFSNPSDPKQWDDLAIAARKGRPMHTLDRCNKYVQHVVNSHRQAKTSYDVMPVDSKADPDVAQKLTGIIRHIEYVSRASIAWDTASDHPSYRVRFPSLYCLGYRFRSPSKGRFGLGKDTSSPNRSVDEPA